MRLIDYQAMNAGSKKFRSSPYAWVHWVKHQGNQWYREEKASKLDDTILPKCRCCDKGKTETIWHVIQCKLRATINKKKMKQFTELMRQVEMPNDIQKLLEMLIWELLRCINGYTNHPVKAIWGAEDLGTILEYLAPRWRYSAHRPGIKPVNGIANNPGIKPGNQRRQRWTLPSNRYG